ALIAGVVGYLVTIYFVFQPSFAKAFDNWMISLLLWMSPWAGVILADFYVVRGGRIDVDELYREPVRSAYGDINWGAIIAFLVGLVAGWAVAARRPRGRPRRGRSAAPSSAAGGDSSLPVVPIWPSAAATRRLQCRNRQAAPGGSYFPVTRRGFPRYRDRVPARLLRPSPLGLVDRVGVRRRPLTSRRARDDERDVPENGPQARSVFDPRLDY